MARARTYKLPSGKKTTRADSFKKQWTEFVKPVAKALKLSIGSFDSSEVELLAMWKKGNGKQVPEARITVPHWFIWKIQQRFNWYQRQINSLTNHLNRLHKENIYFRQYIAELEKEKNGQA